MARMPTGNPVGRPRLTADEKAARAAARQATATPAINAKYDAAGHGRRLRGWVTPTSGPNRAITGLQKIRDRSRDLGRNDWAGESASQKWQTTLIGVGIVPRFKRITSVERRQFITDLFLRWGAQADADCVLNVFGQQTLGVGTWVEGGEYFLRRRMRSLVDDLAVPVQVQMYEPEQCPMLDATSWPGLPQGNKIKSGIEVNRVGKRVAYWFYKEHPGDGYQGTINAQDLIRVPASEVRHVYKPRRIGQMRGVPAIASVITRLRNTGDFDDATLERQKLANLFVAFRKQTLAPEDRIDPSTGKLIVVDEDDTPLAPMMPGTTQELGPGEEMQFANPPEAGTTYSEYMRTQYMGSAAAAGIPYEIYAGDIKDISDRTLRVLINEFRRLAEQYQWQIVIPMHCQTVVEWFADAAFLAGLISQEERDLVKLCEHAPHGWAHIHPVQDPQGKKLEVDAGFRSRSSVIGERGDDPDAVDQERANDVQREKDLDLWVDPAAAVNSGQQQRDDDPANQ